MKNKQQLGSDAKARIAEIGKEAFGVEACFNFSETLEEAKENILEAIEDYGKDAFDFLYDVAVQLFQDKGIKVE